MSGEGRGIRHLVDGNLPVTLEQHAVARQWLDRPALHTEDGPVTHGELYAAAARAGSLLRSLGVSEGSRVLMAASDGAAFAAAFLGALRIGAVPVTVNPLLTERDHAAFVDDVSPEAVVADAAVAARFAAVPAVVEAEDLLGRARSHEPAAPASLSDDAPGYVQFTSGTTGRPKGAVHRQRDALGYFAAVAEGVYGLGPDDVFLCVSKMFFAYGLPTSLFHPLLSGASAVLVKDRPTPAAVTALCERHGVTILLSVPTFFANLVDAGDPRPFRTVRLAVSGGEPLLPRLKASAEDLLGAPVLNHLGSTEVGHGFVGDTPTSHRAGTAGAALPPYAVDVRDDSGQSVPPGEQGVVWVSGPTVMLGYLDRPDETAATKVGDWLRTGDLGVLDEDGYLTLRGRADDIEIVSGHKVWPGEIEAALGRHEAVVASAVLGETEERGSTRLRALVVLRSGATGDRHLVEELVALARAEVAPFKVPRVFTFVDELPRTATGKLQRFRLRQDLGAFVDGMPTYARPVAPADQPEKVDQ